MSEYVKWRLFWVRSLGCVALCCAVLLASSTYIRTSSTDVSAETPYRELIGRAYRVEANDLNAHFNRDDYPNREPKSVTLMSGVGYQNRFVAFRRHVEPGSVVRIVSVRRSWDLAGRYYYCIVEFVNTDLAQGLPVEADLNDRPGGGVELDPRVYKALTH